jgi:outer membrane protein TolC
MRHAACGVRLWPGRLAISFFVCLGVVPAARAQHAVELPPPRHNEPSPLTLADCVRIGLERQPALLAQRATLAAAEAQRQALDHLTCAALISKELPIRKQQGSLGIAIAQAGLQQAEWETIYAVARVYYTIVYARRQEVVARGLLEKLEISRKNAEAMVKQGKVEFKVTQEDVDKLAVNIDLLQLRLIEATTGIERATAALREAMGVRYDAPLPLHFEDFPAPGDTLDRETLVQLALSRRGELVQAACAARIAELEVCAQNTGCLLPFKTTFAAVSDIHSRPIPQGTSNATYRPGATGIEMPATIVGHKADRVARAQEFSNRAASVVDKTQNLIALETEDAFYKWQTAAAQVKTLRESAVKAAKLADLVSRRFDDGGKASAEDYLRARTLEDQTQAQLNEALFHHVLALAALERVTAGGFIPSFRHSPTATHKGPP